MNPAEIIQLARRYQLQLEENSIKVNESGLDFRVAHAKDSTGEKWILRIPRREDSLKHGKKEQAALMILNKQVSFQVPQWTIFSKELIAYKELNGTPAATIDMEKQAYVWTFDETKVPYSYLQSLGKVMADLHNVPSDQMALTGVDILNGVSLQSHMEKRMNNVKNHFDIHPKLWARWQAWLENDTIWPTFSGVKHGDLHPGHILLNKELEVTGIIDWTEVSVGDVSDDFAAHYQLFGEEGLDQLLVTYEQGGGRVWQGMKQHIIELRAASPVLVAEFALLSGLNDMVEMAKTMLSSDG
ncbi:macrolide 2'-phosphotransferase [Shouchella miscanthi]|uniref:Macrolide 2'-phosphotransferase n=1 Tax=Shouchella miscanthi TaxID=2598861 RepID=A0ABU6NPU2_9BACI|nr:macrolide 2'-phosphotransferase [Shouchella miscanthi]